ncbi:hypothetical protein M433DRAFT_279010 [Acidomyces richmondensis BFW]|nr:MAG: hypothetical protein FE78DRAFT_434796 [Acidomyces sp. 'richmondensis']KYG44930.1 hypothetical protein M433DRAFT_279010 [Acidomyces richmondensis BFW]
MIWRYSIRGIHRRRERSRATGKGSRREGVCMFQILAASLSCQASTRACCKYAIAPLAQIFDACAGSMGRRGNVLGQRTHAHAHFWAGRISPRVRAEASTRPLPMPSPTGRLIKDWALHV